MKIQELIEMLEEFDGDTEVRIMAQENWPFENAVEGVTERSRFEDTDDPDDPEGEPNCVFLVEGRQLKYGNKEAWCSCN
jgi:hypothetical protein